MIAAATLRSPALACSVALHAGLLAGMWPSSTADMPQQQVIDIQVVAISSEAQQPASSAQTPMPVPPAPIRPSVANQNPPTPKQAPKQSQPHEQTAQTPPTSGPQAEHANETVAALTEPVYNAAYLHNTPPAYPEGARRKGIEGDVVLDVDVSPQGDARAVSIRRSSGDPLLDVTAQNAVKEWRFVPAQRGNDKVESRVLVPVEFRLE